MKANWWSGVHRVWRQEPAGYNLWAWCLSPLFCQSDICPKAHAETYPQGGSVSPTTHVSATLTLFKSLILHRHKQAKTHSIPTGSFCKHRKNLISDHWVISSYAARTWKRISNENQSLLPDINSVFLVRWEILQYIGYSNVNWQSRLFTLMISLWIYNWPWLIWTSNEICATQACTVRINKTLQVYKPKLG